MLCLEKRFSIVFFFWLTCCFWRSGFLFFFFFFWLRCCFCRSVFLLLFFLAEVLFLEMSFSIIIIIFFFC